MGGMECSRIDLTAQNGLVDTRMNKTGWLKIDWLERTD